MQPIIYNNNNIVNDFTIVEVKVEFNWIKYTIYGYKVPIIYD